MNKHELKHLHDRRADDRRESGNFNLVSQIKLFSNGAVKLSTFLLSHRSEEFLSKEPLKD